MSFYLLEIGCEELPASFIPLACDYLKSSVLNLCKDEALSFGDVKSDGTPRRIYLYIKDLQEIQEDRVESFRGPSVDIAFDIDGNLTNAGLKFLKSKGLDVATASKLETDKGVYLVGSKTITGKSSKEILQQYMGNMILNIPFPKTMRWGSHEIRFARPIKYILSIFDNDVLKFDISEFTQSNTSVGHSFLSPGVFKVTDFDSYINDLRHRFVIANFDDRKSSIRNQLTDLGSSKDCVVDIDEGLLNTVSNITEYPYCIMGNFDDSFLSLPEEVLITSMKNHQKYFPVRDKQGRLVSAFVGVSNMKPHDCSLIQDGYERVLKARLNDALFFYNNDIKVPLEKRATSLSKVVYQEKLGTYKDKVDRIFSIASYLSSTLSPNDESLVNRASKLCKADLMCEMVYEFPELQGIMGGIYALVQGEDPIVANAIRQHYMPTFAGDMLPSNMVGKIVAIADKLDTICGAFAIGMIPSGSADPYGIRRSTIGVLNIILSLDTRLSLRSLIGHSLHSLSDRMTEEYDKTSERILSYFLQRYKQMLLSEKSVTYDSLDAAEIYFNDIIEYKNISEALTMSKDSEYFKGISEAFKRINNILKKYDSNIGNSGAENINVSLFDQKEEAELYNYYTSKLPVVDQLVTQGKWGDAISELSSFSSILKAYFDNVMVMVDNDDVRSNRILQLKLLRNLFVKVGDLSKLV